MTEKTGPWGGLMLHAKDFRPLVRRPGLLERGTLRFEVNGGCDQFGNARGGQKIQLTLLAAGRDFRQNRHGAMQNLENGLAEKAVDNDPATFQEVRIPLSRFGKLPENANGLFFQLRGDNSSGFEIRDIVIELPEEDDPPPVPVRTERLLPVNPKELYAIGQVRVQAENGGVAVQTATESGPWSGFITHFAPLPDITPEEWKNGSLEFELDGGKTGGQQLQFTLSDRRTKQNSRQVSAGKIVPGRQTVTLPLGAFAVDGRAPEVTSPHGPVPGRQKRNRPVHHGPGQNRHGKIAYSSRSWIISSFSSTSPLRRRALTVWRGSAEIASRGASAAFSSSSRITLARSMTGCGIPASFATWIP